MSFSQTDIRRILCIFSDVRELPERCEEGEEQFSSGIQVAHIERRCYGSSTLNQ